MKNIIKLLPVLAIALVLQSCATVSRNSTFKTSSTELQVQMSDLVFVGETEVSVTYRTLFGVFRHIDLVNGEEFDASNKEYTDLNGSLGTAYAGPLKKAYGKVLKEYPDARYFQVVRISKKTDRLFLGTDSEVKAVVRAYKFRTDYAPRCCQKK
ncbi:MAG: hypothetical protein IJ064_01140 [Bacteroidaceae bacterium]|nr:hypothetical protein [Bacteroidaceae bacterium]